MSAESLPPPGDQPEDLDAAFREFAEFDFANKELLFKLHLIYEASQDSDEQRDDNFDRLGALSAAVEKPRHAILGDDPAVMGPLYHEMRWQPKQGTETAVGVEQIMVRHPILTGSMYSVLEGSSVTPNDIFIEVLYRNGENFRFLLNDAGITPYADAESVEFNDGEIMDIERDPAERPNTFAVNILHPFAPPLSARDMDRMIFSDSQLKSAA